MRRVCIERRYSFCLSLSLREVVDCIFENTIHQSRVALLSAVLSLSLSLISIGKRCIQTLWHESTLYQWLMDTWDNRYCTSLLNDVINKSQSNNSTTVATANTKKDGAHKRIYNKVSLSSFFYTLSLLSLNRSNFVLRVTRRTMVSPRRPKFILV